MNSSTSTAIHRWATGFATAAFTMALTTAFAGSAMAAGVKHQPGTQAAKPLPRQGTEAANLLVGDEFSVASEPGLGFPQTVGTHFHSGMQSEFDTDPDLIEVGQLCDQMGCEEIRGMAEFDIRNVSEAETVTFAFEVLLLGGLFQQMGPGDFDIEIVVYTGNGMEDIDDYRAGTFGFAGQLDSSDLLLNERVTIDVTSLYNIAFENGMDHIGFRFQAGDNPMGDAVVFGDATLEVISGTSGGPDPLGVDLEIIPGSVERGESALVVWESRGASECTAENGLPGWAGDKALSGSQSFIPQESGDFTFRLTCRQFIVAQTRTATLRVLDGGPPPPMPGPEVALAANRSSVSVGDQIELSWTSEGATACTASSGLPGFNGEVPLNGSLRLDAEVTGLARFELDCEDLDGRVAGDRVDVEINGSNPDLFVSAFSSNATELAAGSNFQVSLRAGNLGDAASPSTRVRFYLSDNAAISTADLQAGSVALSSVSVGATQNAPNLNIATPRDAGRYWIGACIDTVAGETEVANNCSEPIELAVQSQNGCAEAATACGAIVDGGLSAQDCQGGPRGAGFAASKQTITLNQGAEIAFDAQFNGMDGLLTLQAPNGGPFVVSNDDFGGTDRSRVEYVAEQAGEYTLWVTSFETGETGGFEVETICGDDAPDFVARPESLPREAQIDELLDLTFSYENQGERGGQGFLALVLSPDSTIDPDDVVQMEIGFGGLAAGSSGTHTFSGRFQSPGVYWVGACVRDGSDGELFSTNNCSEGRQLVVRNPGSCVTQPLAVNNSANGSVVDEDCDDSPRGAGYPSRGYTFSGSAGQLINAQVDWDGWDGYVYIEGPDGRVVGEADDLQENIFGLQDLQRHKARDGLQGVLPPSRIENTAEETSLTTLLPSDGEYTVWLTGYQPRNKGDYQVTLNEVQADGVDLRVDSPALPAGTVEAGSQVAVSVDVSDQAGNGGFAAEVFFLLSTNSTLSAEDRRFATRVTPTLNGDNSATVSAFFDAPLSPGRYWVGACAQPEGSEGNNLALASCESTVFTVTSDAPRITFNPGLNDTWFNPETDGQGFFVEVFQDIGSVFLTWFTYETAGTSVSNNANIGDTRHRWFTAQGSYDESGVDLTVILTRGGIFDQGSNVTREEVGTMRLEFLGCNAGVLSYEIDAQASGTLSGTIPIQRVATDNQAICEDFIANEAQGAGQALLAVSQPEVQTGERVNVVWQAPEGMQCRAAGTAASWDGKLLPGTGGTLALPLETSGEHALFLKCKDGLGRSVRKEARVTATPKGDRPLSSGPEIIVNEGLNDAWADPETDGQGLLINVFPELESVFAAWFTYDNFDASGGNADVGSADHRWLTAFGPIEGNRTEMDLFVNRGGAFDQGQPAPSSPYGTLDLTFDSCDAISASYEIPSEGASGTMDLRRIVQDRVASCLTKGSNGEDEGRLVRPENKERLPNACNGQLDWVFDWEAFPNATSYEIEVRHARDENPRVREQTSTNTYRMRKTESVPDDQLDGWTWRVRWLRVDTFTILEGPWSEYEFAVEPVTACN